MLAAIDEWRPDVILREFGETGSFVAAELRDLPQLQVLISLDKFVEFTISMAAPTLAGVCESYGLPPDGAGDRLRRVPSLSLLPFSFEEPDSLAGRRFSVTANRPPTPGRPCPLPGGPIPTTRWSI